MNNKKEHRNYNFLEYEDIVVVDKKGVVVFYDIANMGLFDLKPEKTIGNKITSLYNNLADESSTLMRAAKHGISICDYKQELKTTKNRIVKQIGSTFPIMDNGIPVGAIEFSKPLYDNENICYLQEHSVHKVYRKNNTIYTIEDIKSMDPRINAIKGKIKRIADTDSSVLICGATGTGKEMIAQSIHNCSGRRTHPFISLNCGAIPATLLESTLFGTIKGSYTGAEDRAGLFETANYGTLFLDEINSMDTIMQVKLLKAIEEKRVRRVGDTKVINLDVRIIAAINQDVRDLIERRQIRDDLFYRLAVVQINIPPLRERLKDIEYLTNYFIEYYNNRLEKQIEGVSPEVSELFRNYDWPGNVRELKNIIEGAFNIVTENVICVKDLPDRLFGTRYDKKLDLSLIEQIGLKSYIEEHEREIIEEAINRFGDNMSEVARKLKISRQLLRYKMGR